MTPEEEDELYSVLNYLIPAVSLLVFTGYLVSYKLMPAVIPGEPKIGPLQLFLGTSVLKFVRRPGDPPFTSDSFPGEKAAVGTPRYNVLSFTEEMANAWDPKKDTTLLYSTLRHIFPWWIYSMCMFSGERLIMYLNMAYISTILITLFTSERVPYFGGASLKLMLLGFITAIGSHSLNQWCKMILAIRGTDPAYVGMSMLVVQKMQRLSSRGLLETNAAEAQQIAQECYNFAVSMWSTPLQTCILDVILGVVSARNLYSLVGVWGIILASLCIGMMFGVGTLCDMKNKTLNESSYQATVQRQVILNRLLENFRELRVYNWVERVARPMEGVRKQIKYNSMWAAIFSAVGGVFTSQIDGIMTVATCFFIVFVRGDRVSFAEAQMSRAYMGALMMIVTSLSFCRMSWIDMVQRAGRIEKFLRLPELEVQELLEGPMEVAGGTFCYAVKPKKDEAGEDITPPPQTVLSDVNFKAEPGELVLVCGAIGSGKSSLLQALLGELPMTAGKRWLPKEAVAYQPQVPYLVDGTIRDNVLFGIADDDCNDDHMQRALAAAQLAVDIRDPGSTLHSKGENTDVGKRGTHLSGGQRARTALARSVYAVLQGAPVALLDDPVASVDNEVVQAAWEGAVLGAMKGVTRVVVVNSQLLERLAGSADRLLVLSEGKIVYNGPPAEAFKDQEVLGKALSGKYELSASVKKRVVWAWAPTGLQAVQAFLQFFGFPKEGDEFTQDHLDILQKNSPVPQTFEGLAEQGFIKESENADALQAAPPPAAPEPEEEAGGEDASLALADMLRESEPMRTFLQQPLPFSPEDASTEPLLPEEAPLKLGPEEWEDLRLKLQRIERQNRHVEEATTKKLTTPQLVLHFLYISAGMFTICMVLQVVNGFKDAVVLETIQRWSVRSEAETDWSYLRMLIWVFVGFALIGVFTGVLDGYGQLRLTMHLMTCIDESIAALGLPFFWRKKQLAEPQVRKVVNTDLGSLGNIARMPMMCLECMILICITSVQAPLLWILMPVSLIGYWTISFLPDWRNLQLWPAREQLQNTAWSKVVEQFDMLPAIRGLKRQREFERKTYRGIMVVGWSNVMNFQIEILISVYHHVIGAIWSAAALGVIIRMRSAGAEPSTAYAFWTLATNFNNKVDQLVGMYMPFKDLLKQYDQMEDIFVSNALETDAGVNPPSGWPAEGKIEFDKVTFRYVAYLPPALKDVSVTVQPGEKFGVVGKTGSGKSTLMSLLLRLGPLKGVAPSSGGRVLLDGVDVATLRLSDLRQKIGVVPQEPTLFSMTLKENIGEEFTDAEVLTGLQWCGLDARQLTGKEDGPIAEALAADLRSGSLSVGQQQLIMAARALVRRPKVLILDECTASLDRESADRLLDVLNTHSNDVTVLSIAHRLRFLLKSDRIMVLSMGKILECDTPAKLLENPDSYFSENLKYEQQQESSD